MARLFRFSALFGALALILLVPYGPAGGVDPAVTSAAVAYLRSQQIGGTTPATGSGAWDTDPAFEFVTTEAVLALGEGGQSGGSWSASEALAAVQAADNPDGLDPLAFLDLVAAGPLTPGKAGKLILLVAEPLGLDPAAFDPAGDGSPVNLTAAVGSPNPDGSFGAPGFFNNTLFAALAKELVDGAVPAQTVAYIRSVQKANGGWSFDADPGTTTDADVDTTSFAVQALIAGGAASTDPDVREGLGFIASQMNADGTWSAFGNVNAESTSRAILAIVAAGYDVNSSCWRDTVVPGSTGAAYVSPDTALAGLRQADGSIAGPGVFSVPFATAQSAQGLERGWLPVARGASQTCATTTPPAVLGSTTGSAGAAPATAVVGQPSFTG
ncbi:MAG: prenyltransferase/squalene oxidase repeat-containing protein [Acidimicrobiia bacterium]